MDILDETETELLLHQILWMDDWIEPQPTIEPPPASCESPKVVIGPVAPGRQNAINPSRTRRKHELVSLRAQEKELREQLQTLQRRRERRLKEHADFKNGSVASVAPVWEAVARRQLEARRKTETVNSQLKAKLTAQNQIIHDIFELMQQAQLEHEIELGFAEVPTVCIPDRISQGMSDDEQVERVDALMMQWEAVFSLNEKFLTPCVEFYDARVVPTVDRAIVLEVTSSVALPFALERVDKVLWTLHENNINEDNDGISLQQHRSTNDTIIGVYSSMLRLQTMRGAINGKFVAKRYAPHFSQCLLVTHTFSEAEGVFNGLDGVKISEDSWMRPVDALELGLSSLQTPLTLLQYVGRTRIALDARHRAGCTNISETTTVFLAHIQRELEWVHKVLEKNLMQPDAGRKVVV